MGMFDTALVEIDGKEVHFQFKSYLGKYEPNDNVVRIGESMPRFPRIPYYEIDGYNFTHKDCILKFTKGILKGFEYPLPDDYGLADLPAPRKWKQERRYKIWAEKQGRIRASYEARRAKGLPDADGWQELGAIMGEQLLDDMRRPGIVAMLFRDKKYPNHMKYHGKWVRIYPL